MPGHRSFALPSEADLHVDGPSFELGDEPFRCVPIAPAGLLAEMVAAVSTDRTGNAVFRAVDLNRFALGVIAHEVWEWDPEPPLPDYVEGEDQAVRVAPERTGRWIDVDDRKRFEAFLFDDTRPVPVATLGEIVVWLINEYTERPTGAPAPSGRGRSHAAAT
jgi:hypothetical protein